MQEAVHVQMASNAFKLTSYQRRQLPVEVDAVGKLKNNSAAGKSSPQRPRALTVQIRQLRALCNGDEQPADVLLDNLVSDDEKRGRHGQAECFRGFEIYDELE